MKKETFSFEQESSRNFKSEILESAPVVIDTSRCKVSCLARYVQIFIILRFTGSRDV